MLNLFRSRVVGVESPHEARNATVTHPVYYLLEENVQHLGGAKPGDRLHLVNTSDALVSPS